MTIEQKVLAEIDRLTGQIKAIKAQKHMIQRDFGWLAAIMEVRGRLKKIAFAKVKT
jgi:hypothetical protein